MATPQQEASPDDKPSSEYTFTFPPFPNTPEDVKIIAFKDFEEGGIRVNPGPDEAEVDSFGIQTVVVSKKHDTDVCKTKTKRKREADVAQLRNDVGRKMTKEWWQEWEETEAIRYTTGVDR